MQSSETQQLLVWVEGKISVDMLADELERAGLYFCAVPLLLCPGSQTLGPHLQNQNTEEQVSVVERWRSQCSYHPIIRSTEVDFCLAAWLSWDMAWENLGVLSSFSEFQ